MGRRGPESFLKRQKELKRRQKAQEKRERRYAASKARREGNPPVETQGVQEEAIGAGGEEQSEPVTP